MTDSAARPRPSPPSANAVPCYITTPIYYVNDRPHIGHCYTTILADVLARFERLARGLPLHAGASGLGVGGVGGVGGGVGGACPEVFLLTGTDEHADKVVTSAAAHGKTPQEWADENAAAFRRAFALMGVQPDDFIRTTEPRHRTRVPVYIQRLIDSGDIYKGAYTGWYDEGQEEYVTESAARDADFKGTISRRPLVQRTEDCYFFRLGNYQQRLLDLLQSDPTFVQPDARRQEVLGRLRAPAVLHDVPVSRPVTSDPATQWGIRIPGDDQHRVYVWIDALFNYLTVVDTAERRHLWPPRVHLIGKDILWFHAVIWPALLMALHEPLPRVVYGHGWWVSNGQKMSKSLGNFIDLERIAAYADRFSLDGLRWFLVTQGPLSGSDSDFSHGKFVETYNADLANGIGNCVSRVGNMVERYFGGVLPDGGGGSTYEAGGERFDWSAWAREAVEAALGHVEGLDVGSASVVALTLVRRVDGFINSTRPFSIAKEMDKDPHARARLGVILYQCAEAIRIASILMAPAMPGKVAELWRTWDCVPPPGATLASLCEFRGPCALRAGQRIAKGEILFQRADPAAAL